MRLADFIESNYEPILAEWVAYAETCGPVGGTMDLTALRDHALQMLQVIVVDLRTAQTPKEQADKSKGIATDDAKAPDTAAEVHGAGRAESGFSVAEMVSEYRALRASVLRLWTKANGQLTGDDLQDLVRFNEAIDQSIAESLTRYSSDIDQSKDMFIAILGHDLRTPIGAVMTASQFMLDSGELVEPNLTLVSRIVRSSKRMTRMVADLLDFTRTRLGSGLAITRANMDLGREVSNAMEELKAANPQSTLELETGGDLRGNWDCGRISQVMANLLGNAVQHGAPKSPIKVSARGEANEVVVTVKNRGPTIAPASIPGIFNPLKRIGEADETRTGSLGLGLYIAERIVTAHGGTIEVRSSDEDGTTFTFRLPR